MNKPTISVTFDGYKSGSWVGGDITSAIVSPIKYKHGIFNITQSDRASDIGTMKFTLNNTSGCYVPDPDVFNGWEKGTIVTLTVTYSEDETISVTKWVGKVEDLKPKRPLGDLPTVEVTCVDATSDLVNYQLPLIAIQTNKTFETGTDYLLSYIPSRFWKHWTYNPTTSTTGKVFPTVFDTGQKMTIFSEINKMALSELGYFYTRFTTGSTAYLTLENYDDRNVSGYTRYSQYITSNGSLQKEDGFYLLQENGDKLAIDMTTYTFINNNFVDYEMEYGKNLINEFTVKIYPRSVDSGSSVLFSMDKPLTLTSGSTKYLKFSYANPRASSDRVGVLYDINHPVVLWGQMYAESSGSSGSGTDLSASLSMQMVDENHESSGAGSYSTIVKFTSSASVTGYVTAFQFKGFGIYFDNPVEYYVSASTSQAEYGVYSETLDQKYLSDFSINSTSIALANLVIYEEQSPRKVLKSIKFIPNTSRDLLLSYLYNDVGDRILVWFTDEDISHAFYIQGIETEILLGGVIQSKWTLIESSSNFIS